MIYLDSGIIIRLIEGVPSVRDPIETRLASVRVEQCFLVTSRLSRLECRTRPIRQNDISLLALYDAFFEGRELTVAEVNSAVIETATEIRSRFGLKAPDAIHAATATIADVSEFWTADHGFNRYMKLPVVLFPAV